MTSLTSSPSSVVLAILVPFLTYYLLSKKKSKLPYPPGPKPHFLLGNLKEFTAARPWAEYMRIANSLDSPVIHVHTLGMHWIVVNDYATAQDLLEKRSALYSDRPRLVVLQEMAGFGWNFGLMPYGETWKTCRRLFEAHFKQSESRKLHSREEENARNLLKLLLDKSQDLAQHSYFHATRLILDLGYGIEVDGPDDPYVQITTNADHAFKRTSEGLICELFPLAKYLPSWVPGMGWKKQNSAWNEWATKMVNTPFDAVASGAVTKPSMATRLVDILEAQEDSRVTLDMVKGTLATLFIAGTDTTSSTLKWIVLLLLLFPDVQSRAQAELDQIVGEDRLPGLEDKPRLPYIRAFIKELLRWTCIVPFAIPHAVNSDDIWVGRDGNSYHIPKGATVVGNAWAMSRDPNVYTDPDTFNPERFLTKDCKALDPAVAEPDFVFGFKARQCAGRWMAEDVLFISAASILSTFNISELPDFKVQDRNIEALCDPDMVVHPKPFRCNILPRSQKAISLIQNE